MLQERGIALTTPYPKPLSDSVLRAADVIITMGCGDSCPIFPGKRYEDWDVADPGRSRSRPSGRSVTTSRHASPAPCRNILD